MARKDVLLGITQADSSRSDRQVNTGYASRGASRSMISSLGELAEKAARADQLLDGEVVTELDPSLIDASFVSDRIEDNDNSFEELVAAIRDRGQDSPVLVRPNPSKPGRFQIVFGHRRVRAARQIGKPVRAVVKAIEDIDHVIAQGQENSARENLSFVEKATFAQQLLDLKYGRPTIQSALSVDAPMLTRMLSVTSRVPHALIVAIGPAKTVGRDRWMELTQLIEVPANALKATALVSEPDFLRLRSDERFDHLLALLKKAAPSLKKTMRSQSTETWQAVDKAILAEFGSSGKAYSLTLKQKDASRFGKFLSENLDKFYEMFREHESNEMIDREG